MRVVVTEGPEPIATPSDIPGGHAANDALVMTMIAAAQASIDGPTGWLGRALGRQTLELVASCWPSSLPYRPIGDVQSVTVDGVAIEGVTVEFDGMLVIPTGAPRPTGEIRIVYRTGYEAEKVPAHAKAAVILMTQELLAQAKADGGLRTFSVDGAYSEAYNSPEMVEKARTAAVDRLLAPLRVYS